MHILMENISNISIKSEYWESTMLKSGVDEILLAAGTVTDFISILKIIFDIFLIQMVRVLMKSYIRKFIKEKVVSGE